MGGEAGFSAPLLAKARAAPVEMTMFGGVGEKGTRVATLSSKMRGFFATLRMTT